jgi:hypothetical protein
MRMTIQFRAILLKCTFPSKLAVLPEVSHPGVFCKDREDGVFKGVIRDKTDSVKTAATYG